MTPSVVFGIRGHSSTSLSAQVTEDSGYFNIVSVQTTEMAKFGSDLTPAGRPRVHQELPGSNLYLY